MLTLRSQNNGSASLSNDEEAKAIWRPNIHILQTEKFYSLKAYSGYLMQFADPEAHEILLESNASDEELGKAVLACLKQSRHLPRDYAWTLQQQARQKTQEWIPNMVKFYNYKGKRALLKNMQKCGVYLQGDLLIIRPTNHDRFEGWSGEGITEEDHVKISADSSPEEIGAALRLAFTRCK